MTGSAHQQTLDLGGLLLAARDSSLISVRTLGRSCCSLAAFLPSHFCPVGLEHSSLLTPPTAGTYPDGQLIFHCVWPSDNFSNMELICQVYLRKCTKQGGQALRRILCSLIIQLGMLHPVPIKLAWSSELFSINNAFWGKKKKRYFFN